MDVTRPRSPAPPPHGRGVRDIFSGAGYLLRGLGWIARRPGQWLIGLVPAGIALVAYVAGLVFLGFHVDGLARGATSFADGWPELAGQAVQVAAVVAIYGSALLVALVTFTTVTLLIGQPFYERIAENVEESAGGAPPPPDVPLVRQLVRAVRDGLVVACLATMIGLALLVLGFVPVVGQTVIPLLGAAVSGYFLSAELTSIALERRGLGRRQRFARLRRHRWLAIGFGGLTVLIFLIPLGAVLAMPGAVAGGTLLARERLADPLAEAIEDPAEGPETG